MAVYTCFTHLASLSLVINLSTQLTVTCELASPKLLTFFLDSILTIAAESVTAHPSVTCAR